MADMPDKEVIIILSTTIINQDLQLQLKKVSPIAFFHQTQMMGNT